jgi:DNA repair protein SbcC/Rad50
MITKLFNRTALHEHIEPAQRLLGVEELPPDSDELAQLVTGDPAPDVRAAAARRCRDLATLAAAWRAEADPAVQPAVAAALVEALAQTPDATAARAMLDADECTDVIRVDVARRAADADRRRVAVAAIRGEDALVEVALGAGHAETRMAATERVHGPDNLRRLADAARNKDHGVARLARQRTDALDHRADQAAKADAIIAELEALAVRAGPIVTPLIELDRRWQAIEIGDDAERIARCDAARRAIQARFDREQEEQRTRARFDRGLREWHKALAPPATAEESAALGGALADWRTQAQQYADTTALADLIVAEQRIAKWDGERRAQADAEALVIEAEQLAATTSIDNANLPQRWQALDRTIRTPALTRRFEAALMVVEQRRLEQIRAAQHEASAARQRVHDLLHTAEQALAAGQLQAARAAADEIRAHKAGAGPLPKPTTQRLGRVVQQLTDLERWESFGQQNARVQLCERAEAIAAQTLDAAQIAQDVQKLRNEWKALDAQHAGVPKALWERFDRACEKAYAPAAKHFAELAAQRREARKQRDEFIAAAAAHAPTLLTESPDWRAIERWLRDTDHTWREGKLGSVDPGAWKKLDARLKAAVAPLRDALSAARDKAKAGRQALIDEAVGLGAKAMDRDAPSQIKALQVRWQEQAKALALAQRDERVLWEQFRAACDAVFTARDAKRKEEDGRKHESRRALDELCAEMEKLAAAADKSDQDLKRQARELQDQWKKLTGKFDPALQGVESRFKHARTAVDAMLTARTRSREAAVWQTLAAKERLCEQLDSLVRAGAGADESALGTPSTQEQWLALPALPPAWEPRMAARRDAAVEALATAETSAAHRDRVESGAAARSDALLELEMALGLDSPAEFQAQRLALQVRQLRDRFQSSGTASAASPADRLVAWCATPGVADARDRARAERVFSAMEKLR